MGGSIGKRRRKKREGSKKEDRGRGGRRYGSIKGREGK